MASVGFSPEPEVAFFASLEPGSDDLNFWINSSIRAARSSPLSPELVFSDLVLLCKARSVLTSLSAFSLDIVLPLGRAVALGVLVAEDAVVLGVFAAAALAVGVFAADVPAEPAVVLVGVDDVRL